ncbi:MAG: DUF1566 domain-containing protein [Gammaproteobacteria bacterium]|nr:DUF1566 domain-containing protein [Gammaproteobacteria bacterium]
MEHQEAAMCGVIGKGVVLVVGLLMLPACGNKDDAGKDLDQNQNKTVLIDSEGLAGSRYYRKLDPQGDILPVESASWSCVLDQRSGLIWETKSTEVGLQHKDNTYSWFDPDVAGKEREQGRKNGGECSQSECDTLAYQNSLNGSKICGRVNWRVPSRAELKSLVEKDKAQSKPMVNGFFFVNTLPEGYWSKNSYQDYKVYAWGVLFSNGREGYGYKSSSLHLRLVSDSDDILAQKPSETP